jgi:hypothetical protein
MLVHAQANSLAKAELRRLEELNEDVNGVSRKVFLK